MTATARAGCRLLFRRESYGGGRIPWRSRWLAFDAID